MQDWIASRDGKDACMSANRKILLGMLEFAAWERGRAWSYTGNFAVEEGLSANSVECVVLPAFAGVPPGAQGSWLASARSLFAGLRFDQVWLWLVHIAYDPDFMDFISELAPVRVGWLGESLNYLPEEYAQHPHLIQRRAAVEAQVRRMTHVLAVDEADADYINRNGLSRALWIPMAVPRRYIGDSMASAHRPRAAFYGSIYGERRNWLRRGCADQVLELPPPPENATPFPGQFDELNRHCFQFLSSGAPVSADHLTAYVEGLRVIRRGCFDAWMQDLRQRLAVVNLPSFGKVYTSRVVESMAAGCPVVSWEIPDRPRNRALFEDGQEILLFPKDQPEVLSEHVRRLARDAGTSQAIAARARQKVIQFHTWENRGRQILDWIENGREPAYGEPAASTVCSGAGAGEYYRLLFAHHPARSAPAPNQEEAERGKAVLNHIRIIADLFLPGQPLRMIDVGCGRGWLTQMLSAYGHAEGVDPVEAVIRHARRMFPSVSFSVGCPRTLRQSPIFEPFDIVVCSEVIEHIPYDRQQVFVGELAQLLKKPGFAVLTTPRAEVFDSWMALTNHRLQPVDDWLTEGMLRMRMQKAGFHQLHANWICYSRSDRQFRIQPVGANAGRSIALYQVGVFKHNGREIPADDVA
jgi:2-polyprenyl-3-methyl-5-hydroxy-6-metoxy-1,4-benzoquinol methylase